MAKKPSLKKTVRNIAEKLQMPPEKVDGVVMDLATRLNNDMSKNQIATRWDVDLARVAAIKHMAKVVIADVRDGMVSKNLVIANIAMDETVGRLQDPEELEKVDTKSLFSIAKAATDNALNLTQGHTGGQVNINLAIGDIRALRERTLEARPTLEERLRLTTPIIDATPSNPMDDPMF